MGLLDEGVVFADTPGFGSARPQGCHNQDKECLVRYINENVDEVVFCLGGDSLSLLPEEKTFFESIQPLCSTIVVTKALADEPGDIEGSLQEYKRAFQHVFPLCDFMFVEAKWAIHGGAKSDPSRYEASRIATVRDFIRERGTVEQRRHSLRSQVVRAWTDLSELSSPLLRDAGMQVMPWRSDSWAEFQRCCEADLTGIVEVL